MGQPVTVLEKPSATPGVVRFETNRPLTGMDHERYAAGDEIDDDRPVDELARRLFEHGGVEAIHVNGNVATVRLAQGASTDGMRELIEELFIHYRPGVEPEIPAEPETDEEEADEEEASAEA
jgi:hypothetical protein